MTQNIPVLDLEDFSSGDTRREEKFVQDMGEALREIGFFALKNHGVDYRLIEKSYQTAEALFSLSEAQKKNYEVLELKGQRGFTSFGREHAKNNPAPDLKEFWHVGRDLPRSHPLWADYPQNIWPTEIPEFKEIMQELFRQLDACSVKLLEACALYIGEDRNLIPDMAHEGNTVLRVIHYPEVSADRNPASVRAAAHEDINFITLLCEATTGGLELLQRDGSWLPIHALKGQIIVDSGDMIQNLTNGLLKSTTHRVVNPNNSREKRFSMPFFVHPRSDVSLAPLKKSVARTGGKSVFPNITAGEYLNQRLRELGLSGKKY